MSGPRASVDPNPLSSFFTLPAFVYVLANVEVLAGQANGCGGGAPFT
jgi:hypothetical protein